MTLIIFNHGAKGNAFFTLFMSKFEFLNIDNLHKKFGSDISKIVDFSIVELLWSFLCFLIESKLKK